MYYCSNLQSNYLSMRTKKRLLLLCIVPFFAFTVHKYYISLTQIEFNNSKNSIEVITNVFVDDIETALNAIHSKKFELDTKNELKDSDTYFNEYLQKNLAFKIDGKSVAFNYLGKEYDGDVVFFYLEITDIQSIGTIEVENSLLIKHFPTQQNLVKSKVNKKHKSALLTKSEQTGTLTY
mgnify:CR=1 FL=1